MSRATLDSIITHVRDLIGDEASASQHFTDDQIEAALDRRRSEWNELALMAIRSRTAAGVEQHLKWVAERSPWEDGAVLLDTSFVPFINESDETYTEDATDGVWTFTETQEGVYVTGTTFDTYGAAADLLDQWAISGSASSVASGGQISEWETDGQRVKKTASTSEERRSLAASYRAMSLPVIGSFARSDLSEQVGWVLRP